MIPTGHAHLFRTLGSRKSPTTAWLRLRLRLLQLRLRLRLQRLLLRLAVLRLACGATVGALTSYRCCAQIQRLTA